jgi:hypothetical protein
MGLIITQPLTPDAKTALDEITKSPASPGHASYNATSREPAVVVADYPPASCGIAEK